MAPTEVEGVVARAGQGDPDALTELYGQFGRRVYGLCRHMLGSPEAAEDARGEVFLRLPRALRTYDPALPFSRWLLTVVSHYCLDLLRRRRLEPRLFLGDEAEAVPDPDTAGPTPSPLGRLLLDERREELREALAALPDQYRVPLALRYYGELSYEQIAAELELKRNHVATLIFRAKHELRRRLGTAERTTG